MCFQGLHDPFGFFGDGHGPTHQEDSGVGSALFGPAPGKNEEVAYVVGNEYPHDPGRCFQHGLVRRSPQPGLCEVQDINAPQGEVLTALREGCGCAGLLPRSLPGGRTSS